MKNKTQEELLLTLSDMLEKHMNKLFTVEMRLSIIEQELKRVHPDITLLTDEQITKLLDTMKKIQEE